MSNTRNFSHNSNFFFGTNLFGEQTTYNIQVVNLPGLSFSHINLSRQSSLLNMQGDTITYNDLTVEIIVDEDLKIWKDIVGSLLKMRDGESGLGENLEKSAYLEIHDDNSKRILKLEFENCMIENIDDLSYNTNSDDEIITVSVTIKYDFYQIVTDNNKASLPFTKTE